MTVQPLPTASVTTTQSAAGASPLFRAMPGSVAGDFMAALLHLCSAATGPQTIGNIVNPSGPAANTPSEVNEAERGATVLPAYTLELIPRSIVAERTEVQAARPRTTSKEREAPDTATANEGPGTPLPVVPGCTALQVQSTIPVAVCAAPILGPLHLDAVTAPRPSIERHDAPALSRAVSQRAAATRVAFVAQISDAGPQNAEATGPHIPHPADPVEPAAREAIHGGQRTSLPASSYVEPAADGATVPRPGSSEPENVQPQMPRRASEPMARSSESAAPAPSPQALKQQHHDSPDLRTADAVLPRPASAVVTPADTSSTHITRPHGPENDAPATRGSSPGSASVVTAASEPRHASSTREFVLQVPAKDRPVQVHLVERNGSVRVTVRASDPEVLASLRGNLGDLVRTISQKGFQIEAWTPPESFPSGLVAQPAHSFGAGANESNPDRQPSGPFWQTPDQQQHGHARERWLEEFEKRMEKE